LSKMQMHGEYSFSSNQLPVFSSCIQSRI